MAKKKHNDQEPRKPRAVPTQGPTVQGDGSIAGPDQVLDTTDPGDDVQSRFRYQHGYGVILLVGAVAGRLTYVALWCEHHEDFLAERTDGRFDSYQIKTTTPEHGAWDLKDADLLSALKRFVTLDARFPGKIATFGFVSNVDFFDTIADDKVRRSPACLCRSIAACNGHGSLAAPYTGVVAELATTCGCPVETMFAVLKRLKLIKGPPLESIDTHISHDHLPQVSHCQSLSPTNLNTLRDKLAYQVFDASAVKIDDPAKHWCCVTTLDDSNPRLLAKRIAVTQVEATMRAFGVTPFQFVTGSSSLSLHAGRTELSTLQKKLLKGGLASQLDTMQNRTLSAERHLLEVAASKPPQEALRITNQLRNVVKGVCDDAHVTYASPNTTYGQPMMAYVLEQLQKRANASPSLVCDQPYECLVGVAGLLTEACAVWWSEQFDLGSVT
jgi:hypothetical protein